MKLVIDIPDDLYTKLSKSTEDWACCYVEGWQKTIAQTIRNGKPYKDRPQGEWIRTALYGQTCLECNQCRKADFDIKYDNFCPNCGANMKGGAE